MFIPGQQVVCINDQFHRSIAEWTGHLPRSRNPIALSISAGNWPPTLPDISPKILLTHHNALALKEAEDQFSTI